MNILVTGSSGFLGTQVVRLLKQNSYTVIAIDKVLNQEDESDIFFRLDLRNEDSLSSANIPYFDLCIHLASEVGGFLFNALEESLEQNELDILDGVIFLCKKINCNRIIYTSSINVFEVNGLYTHSSLEEFDQRTPYARAKYKAEKLIEAQFKEFIIIRPTNLFGASHQKVSDSPGISHVIPELIAKIKKSTDYLDVLGDGEQSRNFLHVSDAANFIMKVMISPVSGFFNVRSEITLTINQLANILLKFVGKELPIRYQKEYLSFEPARIHRFDIKPLSKLNWKPFISSIPEGLNCSF